MMKKYRKNLDDNIKHNEEQVKEAQAGLKECLQKMATSKNEKCTATAALSSAKGMYSFICNPNCGEDCYEKIKCICGDPPTMPPGTGTEDCKEDGTPNVRKDKEEWDM